MKPNILIFFSILLVTALSGFKSNYEINNCFISFTTATNLTAAEPEKLPDNSEKFRTIQTESGEVEVTRIDGYRVLYNNDKQVPFVNLKIERSYQNAYETDQNKLIENLKYLNSHSTGMESKELMEFTINGYNILGLSRGSIETGSTLGIFIMFPGNGVTIYFYFNNLKKEFRNFQTLDDYKKQRDRFLDEYTKHLRACIDK